jgi:hypothetical protein
MEALSQESDSHRPVALGREPDQDTRNLSDGELDRRIRGGWDVWCELLDDLLGSGGMLPSRELAGQVVAFFEDDYWRAEEARVEALRRRLSSLQVGRSRVSDVSRGLG